MLAHDRSQRIPAPRKTNVLSGSASRRAEGVREGEESPLARQDIPPTGAAEHACEDHRRTIRLRQALVIEAFIGMASDENDPEHRKKSNTDRVLKPEHTKSRSDPLPRGVVRAPTQTPQSVPAPAPGGNIGGMSPRTPAPPGPPREPGKPKTPQSGPPKAAKDFNAIAERKKATEFNIEARGKRAEREGPHVPKKGRTI